LTLRPVRSAATDAADRRVLEVAAELRADRPSASELPVAVLAGIEVLAAPRRPTARRRGEHVGRLQPERAEAMARAADERIAREREAPLPYGSRSAWLATSLRHRRKAHGVSHRREPEHLPRTD
jgi:hypothetical protein